VHFSTGAVLVLSLLLGYVDLKRGSSGFGRGDAVYRRSGFVSGFVSVPDDSNALGRDFCFFTFAEITQNTLL
jgi:hypothetical protein